MADTIVQILIAFIILSSPLWVIAGIVLLVLSKGKEPAKKKSFIWWGISCIAFPFVFLFLILSIWGVINITQHTFIK